MTDDLQPTRAIPVHPLVAALTATEVQPLFLPPDRVGLPSSWWGHVPFAHVLVHELKPAVVVELGTHHGISFSAFCNAVKQDGLSTRCYAVDTWQGDEQAGFYDESVFDNISRSVQQNYGSFASLMRRTFDDAVGMFADGSVDLLHIDGLHTYEAVAADFATWLPKLSARGVVLFHDTAIYQPGFGVWRFWDEVSQRHPSFTFHHSCGLGMLAPCAAVPDFVAALVAMPPTVAALFRQRLAELGERWLAVDERTRVAFTAEMLRQGQHAAQAEAGRLQHDLLVQAQAAETARETVDGLRQEIAGLQDGVELRQTQIDALAVQGDALQRELGAMSRHANELQVQLEQVRTSMSWRATGPYRVAARLVKRRVLRPLLASPAERQRQRDHGQIAGSGLFDASFYLGRNTAPADRDGVISQYLAASHAAIPRARQHPGPPQRRPVLGFHQLAYAAQCSGFDEGAGEDPLAHYLRTGRPAGPWAHEVIGAHRPPPDAGAGQRILVHAHFHYPDLLDDLLARLGRNTVSYDLLITTTGEAKAAEIAAVLARHEQRATTVVVPNRGRDIGPLLMHMQALEGYDIVGHLHGKRSPQQQGAEGCNWRNFLWDHLVGGAAPMMDVIAEAFAADATLGLVFPEDPNLNHWDMNQGQADKLAVRLGLPHPLPAHFEFPKGTMFWARPAALRPLAGLGWDWGDFPVEPVRSDGTVLHALERLVPFSAAQAGFGFKAVHVPGSWRI